MITILGECDSYLTNSILRQYARGSPEDFLKNNLIKSDVFFEKMLERYILVQ